jgi:hypothetical protein
VRDRANTSSWPTGISLFTRRSHKPARSGARLAGLISLLALSLCAFFASSASAAEPPTVVFGPRTPAETTITVEGTVDIHEGAETEYLLEWKTEHEEWSEEGGHAAFIGIIPAGTSGTTPFTAEATGLEPETGYEFRLFMLSSEYPEYFAPEAGPYPEETTNAATPVPPVISGERVTGVGPENATLDATINSKRFATTYAFEWVRESEGWSSSNVFKSGSLGPLPADNIEREVSFSVTGLTPATSYLWRVTAKNEGGSAVPGESHFATRALATGPLTDCPNEPFRVGFAANLPDCRAYEQATPTDKNGIPVQGLADWLIASSDSSTPRVSFFASAATGIPASGGGRQEFTPMLSSRNTDSWSTQKLFPPETAQARVAFLVGESENLGYALVEARSNPQINNPATVALYLIDTTTESVLQIASIEGETAAYAFAGDAVADDGSYAFFESSNPVASTSGAAPGVSNLYRWDRATDAVALVSKLPASEKGGAAPSSGSFGGAYSWYPEHSPWIGGATNGQYVQAIHAVGPGGGQIYFTAAETGESDSGQIYLRRGLDGSTPTTVGVSKANEGVVDPVIENEYLGVPFPAAFQEATPDGARAFFTSAQKLTTDAATGANDEGNDLYLYDANADPSHPLVDVTGGLETPQSPRGAQVEGLLGINTAGTIGYFVGLGAVATGATPGEPNIYRFEEGVSGKFRLTFVATLSTSNYRENDEGNFSDGTYHNRSPESSFNFLGKTSRVSQSGEDLLFSSVADLTGYDNGGCGTTEPYESPCSEIYLYSQQSKEVICISCDPTGEAAIGPAVLTATFLNVGTLQSPAGQPPISHMTRNLSSDGDRIFFQTPDPLAPGDDNTSSCRYLLHHEGVPRALATCTDTYEWEAPGTPGGSCTKAEVNGGCLYLLSSGTSGDAADFVDASPDGSNVFIATSSPLVPTDRDQLYDLYDVRVGGGLAAQFTQPAAPCEGEGCKSPALQPNASVSAGTSSFVGPGNQTKGAVKCKKGYVKSHGKCVKKKKHKKKKHNKKSKKKHKKTHGHSGSGKGGRK